MTTMGTRILFALVAPTQNRARTTMSLIDIVSVLVCGATISSPLGFDVDCVFPNRHNGIKELLLAVRGNAKASVYVAAKHAVEGITKSVALEVAKSGIRVNAVGPGPTDTGMLTRFTGTPENKARLVAGVPLARLGLSEEVAEGIVYIASDEASFVTGHVLNVDGGHSVN